jgi:hypothetical protein
VVNKEDLFIIKVKAMALEFEILLNSDKLQLNGDDLDALAATLEWQPGSEPYFVCPGRVAWKYLRTPKFDDRGRFPTTFHGLKVKGVGLWAPQSWSTYSGTNVKNASDRAVPPLLEEYEYVGKVKHLGVAGSGEFQVKRAKASPLGGISLERAEREFAIGTHLYRAGLSVTLPIMVAKYPALSFRGRPLGIVVSGVPSRHPLRLDSLIFEEPAIAGLQRSFKADVCRALDKSEYDDAAVLKSIYNLYGQELRRLPEAGLFRHSGGINNAYFDCDNKAAVLTDFDSSLYLEDLPRHCRPLEIIRDCASAVYKLLFRHMHPAALDRFSMKTVKDRGFVDSLLAGYFYESSKGRIDATVQSIWEAVQSIPSFVDLAASTGFESQEAADAAGFDKMAFFAFTIFLLSDLYRDTELGSKFPLEISRPNLRASTRRFLERDCRQSPLSDTLLGV